MKILQKTLLALLALFTITTFTMAKTVTIDSLIIYSQGVATEYGGDVETRIEHLISTTNKIYADSGLNVRLNAVKIQQYDMNDTATSRTILGEIRNDKNITKIRNEVGADNVIIYRPYAHDGACGMGYQNNSLNNPNATWVEKNMYAHVTISCGAYVTAHEIGHNSGLGHSEEQGSHGAYEYARGHGVENTFTTIMAYSTAYHGKKVYKYSSPNLECINSLPCGVEEGEEKSSDAVKALNQTLPLIEKFRVHVDMFDNNNTDDTNESIDNGTERLAEALNVYNEQKDVIFKDKEELTKLKNRYTEIKSEYLEVRTVYSEMKTLHLEKRSMFLNLQATEPKTAYKAYYENIYEPSALALKKYKVDVQEELYLDYKGSIDEYNDFYTNVYTIDNKRLKELKKVYQELKKIYG